MFQHKSDFLNIQYWIFIIFIDHIYTPLYYMIILLQVKRFG